MMTSGLFVPLPVYNSYFAVTLLRSQVTAVCVWGGGGLGGGMGVCIICRMY